MPGKSSIRQSRGSLRQLPPEVSGLQHFDKIVSPATFRPTECLISPSLFPPRAVRCGDERRTRTPVPFAMPPGGARVLSVPGPVIPQHAGPGRPSK